jgi:hypothetical protein
VIIGRAREDFERQCKCVASTVEQQYWQQQPLNVLWLRLCKINDLG